jgi:hypothetical protein
MGIEEGEGSQNICIRNTYNEIIENFSSFEKVMDIQERGGFKRNQN